MTREEYFTFFHLNPRYGLPVFERGPLGETVVCFDKTGECASELTPGQRLAVAVHQPNPVIDFDALRGRTDEEVPKT